MWINQIQMLVHVRLGPLNTINNIQLLIVMIKYISECLN